MELQELERELDEISRRIQTVGIDNSELDFLLARYQALKTILDTFNLNL